MVDLAQQLDNIVQSCSSTAEAKQACQTLLGGISLNPTGDDADIVDPPALAAARQYRDSAPDSLRPVLDDFLGCLDLLERSRSALNPDSRRELANAIRALVDAGFLRKALVEKFRFRENRDYLDKALHNAAARWQMAMVAHWVLDDAGINRLAAGVWHSHCPAVSLPDLIPVLVAKIDLNHVPSLRDYRKTAMHHYPKLSDEEFQALQSDQWHAVIDLPSGRPGHQDIPFITSFVKQGDIEHSLYRYYLMPDLLRHLREAIPNGTGAFDLSGKDRDILFSLPIVIQQIEDELFSQVKKTIASHIRDWAKQLPASAGTETARALAIAKRIWGYRRTPAARECLDPVDNLVKGFTATIRNAFGYFSDVNFAATHGDTLDPLDVAERFVLFASVSNGQLDNLAAAHQRYIDALPNPANWNNEDFFQHFLAVNRDIDIRHIQGHFVVDKTRGCPAIPQIVQYHAIVLDIVLDYVLRQFGEDNLRQAGGWFLQEKTTLKHS